MSNERYRKSATPDLLEVVAGGGLRLADRGGIYAFFGDALRGSAFNTDLYTGRRQNLVQFFEATSRASFIRVLR